MRPAALFLHCAAGTPELRTIEDRVDVMSKEQKPQSTEKMRAASLRAEIDKLTAGDARPEKDKARSASPRDWIRRWMAKHDNNPKDE